MMMYDTKKLIKTNHTIDGITSIAWLKPSQPGTCSGIQPPRNINELVWQQDKAWFLFRGHIPAIIAFLIYIVAATAETNRGPFDLPEAEHELTAGYHTEYSGIHFGFFYLAEYLNLFIVSGIATLMFMVPAKTMIVMMAKPREIS